MRRDVPKLHSVQARRFLLEALLSRLRQLKTPVAAAAFDGVHGHLLLKCTEGRPRILVGIAKQFASAQFNANLKMANDGDDSDLAPQANHRVWAKRSHVTPIADERHFGAVKNYIARHSARGAVVHIAKDFSGKRKNPTA
jgi:hypothetical protein